jgi:hypothetical protein
MFKYNHEYKVVNFATLNDGFKGQEDALNKLAKQGWFVKVGVGNTLILERVKDEEEKAPIPASSERPQQQAQRENPKDHR